MLLSELIVLLDNTGFPVFYDHFPEELGKRMPYIALNDPQSINFYADNRVYQRITRTDIRLYTTAKEPEAEARIIKPLDANEIPWEFEDEGFSVEDGAYSTLFIISGVRPDPEPDEEEKNGEKS